MGLFDRAYTVASRWVDSALNGAPEPQRQIPDGAVKCYVFGRTDDVDIKIDDPYVSPRHARIWEDTNGAVWVEDLGSLNGTFVNDQKITGRTRIRVGDVVQIGKTRLPWKPPRA